MLLLVHLFNLYLRIEVGILHDFLNLFGRKVFDHELLKLFVHALNFVVLKYDNRIIKLIVYSLEFKFGLLFQPNFTKDIILNCLHYLEINNDDR